MGNICRKVELYLYSCYSYSCAFIYFILYEDRTQVHNIKIKMKEILKNTKEYKTPEHKEESTE